MNRIVPAILVIAALAIPVAPAEAGPLKELVGKAFHAAAAFKVKVAPASQGVRALAIIDECISRKLQNQPKGFCP